jgi:cytochrome c oxidase subunit 2
VHTRDELGGAVGASSGRRQAGSAGRRGGRRPGRARGALIATAACAPFLAGCGRQSTLDPESPASHDISVLWWWMMVAAWVVLVGAVVLLGIGWLRRRREGLPIVGNDESLSVGLVVTFGMIIPIISLVALFVVANFSVASVTEAPAANTTSMTIHVTGRQWFWDVSYPGTTAVTANEIHIPVRTRINLIATTGDVIHSFWVPQLQRKVDMIPGRRNRILLYADKPGRYRGQCAELCGLQHAHMAMQVVAEPQPAFRAWLQNMAKPRRAPTTPAERRGEQVFLSNQCASCHTIRGTSARGDVGPDLTHLATRATLAANTIPNREGYLGGWVLDPQHVKPGNKMPGLNLDGPEFQALLSYLQSLK